MANTLTFANLTLTDAHIFGGVSFQTDMNTGEEFSIGNTASTSVSFVTDTQLPLYSKDAVNGTFTWTKDDTARGRFYITEVTKSAGKYTVTAYDAMILLDTSLSALSIPLPATMSDIASAVASYCGCTLSGTMLNGDLAVGTLDTGMTIRQLLAFIAEASGCSVKIDASDQLCFMYYEDSGITLTASDYVSIEVADYVCAPIDNVTIINSLGIVQATAGSGTNSLFISHNPFLENAVETNAQAILSVVDFEYTPLSAELFDESDLEVGTMATIGETQTLIMHLDASETGGRVSSVGSDDRAEYNKSLEIIVNEARNLAYAALDATSVLEAKCTMSTNGFILDAHVYKGNTEITDDYAPGQFKWILRNEDGERLLGRGYSASVGMSQLGYASTVLLEFVKPLLYNLTDHNGLNITDEELTPIHVAHAGEIPTITREVNLYEKGGMKKLLLPLQFFWSDAEGAHITEVTRDEYLADISEAGGNLLATSAGVQIRDGSRPMAQFYRDGVQIGADEDSHIGMTTASISGYNSQGRAYFTMMDAQGMTHRYVAMGNGSTTAFTFFTSNSGAETITKVTIDDVETDEYTVDDTQQWYTLTFDTAPESGATIVMFTAQDEFAPSFSFGANTGATQPPFSLVVGEGCTAEDKHCIAMGESSASNGQASFAAGSHAQAYGDTELGSHGTAIAMGDNVIKSDTGCAIGKYNNYLENAGTTNYLLQVGNGSSEDNRSNALSLDESGNLFIAGTLTQSSDRRIKEHIDYLGEDADDFIRGLKPAHFRKDEHDHVGFYAQEVEEADSWHCMTSEMNGFKALSYTEMIAPLVAYCQHLEQRIAELEKGK